MHAQTLSLCDCEIRMYPQFDRTRAYMVPHCGLISESVTVPGQVLVLFWIPPRSTPKYTFFENSADRDNDPPILLCQVARANVNAMVQPAGSPKGVFGVF